MVIFFILSPTSSHLYPLQVENCDSNSRLVVDEDGSDEFGMKGFKSLSLLASYFVFFHYVYFVYYGEINILHSQRFNRVVNLLEGCNFESFRLKWM